jgi:hypothetical protein
VGVIPTANAFVAVVTARCVLHGILEQRYDKQVRKYNPPTIEYLCELDMETLIDEGLQFLKDELQAIDNAIHLWSWNTA